MLSVAVMEPGKLEIVQVPKPEPGEYDAIVRTEISFICNLTDRKVIQGHMKGMGPESFPLLLGHESAGRVVEVGKKVKNFAIGDRTIGGLLLDPPGGKFKSGWGGHSEYVVIKDHGAMVADGVADEAHGWNEVYKIMQRVPDDVPVEAAGLLCTWREVYSGFFHDFDLRPENRILIFGAGPIGLSFVRFARLRGFRHIACVDINPDKRAKALEFGADEVFAWEDPALTASAKGSHPPFDAVIDAVGSEAIINAAVPLIKSDGKICVFGVLHDPRITVDTGRGPYNFYLILHQWPTRDAEAAALEPLVEWIREGKLDWKKFVTSTFPLEKAAEAVEETKKPSNIKSMLVFPAHLEGKSS